MNLLNTNRVGKKVKKKMMKFRDFHEAKSRIEM